MKRKTRLNESIINCAQRVHNKIIFGFLESVYEKYLLDELMKAGYPIEIGKQVTVPYSRFAAGVLTADFIVADQVVVMVKSVARVDRTHEHQLLNYLAAAGKEVGLVLNFNKDRLDVIRKTKPLVPSD